MYQVVSKNELQRATGITVSDQTIKKIIGRLHIYVHVDQLFEIPLNEDTARPVWIGEKVTYFGI